MRVIYHPHARAELVEAARYYSSKNPALGPRFLNTIDGAVAEIRTAPERWKDQGSGIRHCLLQTFPFAIHYRVERDDLRILAFKHHSREPNYWRYRVE